LRGLAVDHSCVAAPPVEGEQALPPWEIPPVMWVGTETNPPVFIEDVPVSRAPSTGVWQVDGATNLIPIPPAVHRAWKLKTGRPP